jgi:hypothetical protein
MPILTMEESNYAGPIPEDTVLPAKVTAVTQRKKPFKDESGNDIWRMEFSFTVEDPSSDYDGTRLWGDTSTLFNNHPDCVTGDTLLLPLGGLQAVSRSFYSGRLVTIATGATNPPLRVTVNHPVLTQRGWVPAGSLRPGDYVVHQSTGDDPVAGTYLQHMPAFAEEVFEAALTVGSHAKVVTAADDFHGDARFFQGEVDVVSTHGLLWRHNESLLSKELQQKTLVAAGRSGDGSLGFHGSGASAGGLEADVLASPTSVRGLDASSVTAPLADLHAGFDQHPANGALAHVEGGSDDFHRFASGIATDYLTPITGVEIAEWSGHVYNLHTDTQRYMADSIVVHNCKLRAWSQEILNTQLEAGFVLDTDMLVGQRCRIVVGVKEYEKDGQTKVRNFVRDVMRPSGGGVFGSADEEPF